QGLLGLTGLVPGSSPGIWSGPGPRFRGAPGRFSPGPSGARRPRVFRPAPLPSNDCEMRLVADTYGGSMVTMNASGGSTDNTGNRTSPDGAQGDKVRDREATKPTAFLEVEARFAAPEEAVAPSFGFVPGVAGSKDEVRELSAMYLDTEDLRLTRAKHTLRRRTGGPDEGW